MYDRRPTGTRTFGSCETNKLRLSINPYPLLVINGRVSHSRTVSVICFCRNVASSQQQEKCTLAWHKKSHENSVLGTSLRIRKAQWELDHSYATDVGLMPKNRQVSRYQRFYLPRSNCMQKTRLEHLKCRTCGSDLFQCEADLKTRWYVGETPQECSY